MCMFIIVIRSVEDKYNTNGRQMYKTISKTDNVKVIITNI